MPRFRCRARASHSLRGFLKRLFDANLAPQLTKPLAGLYPGSAHVRDLALRADRAIWDFAASDGFVIVSKDSDFYHLSTV
ncbi:MAG: DUF5615 family PIN-like protein [Hyphomonas sp.]